MWAYVVAVGLMSLWLVGLGVLGGVLSVFWVVLWAMSGFSVERMHAKAPEDE